MSNFSLVFDALAPIFTLIVLGLILRRSGFLADDFWSAAERLTYYVLFPALLIHRLSLARLTDYAVVSVAIIIVAMLLGMTALIYALRPWLHVDGRAFTSVYQGVIRFNTYVGLAVAIAVLGTEGEAVAALILAIMVPLINVLCVLVLQVHVDGFLRVSDVLRGLLKNPLILACCAGMGLNLSRLELPPGSAAVFGILAKAALPLGLLAVGAGLRLDGLRQPVLLVAVSGLKLLIMPALAGILCAVVQPGQLETATLMIFAALPGASAAYILARQMGGDVSLVATIITTETALAMLTLPAVLVWVL